MSLKSNPVFIRLTRGAKRPSARATLWLAAGLMLASLSLTVLLMTYDEDTRRASGAAAVLQVASWGLHLVMPLVAAPIAAILTTREAGDEGFQLLRLTPNYSPKGTVWGLIFAALYRLRVPLALMAALLPFVMVEPYRDEKQTARSMCYAFVSREEMKEMTWYSNPNIVDLTCIEPSDSRLLLQSLVILLWPVGLWGAVLFSAALAVWLTLWWGRTAWVWGYVIVVPLCVLVILTLLGPVIGAAFMSFMVTVVRAWPPPQFEAAALFSLAFYPLAWGVMRLARRWA